jgi:cardiolipin synthase
MQLIDILSYHPILYYVILFLYIAILIYTLLRMLFDTNNSTKALAYILLVITLPVAGIIVYFSFGINYRKHKIYSKQLKIGQELRDQITGLYQHQINALSMKDKLGNYYSLAHFLLTDSQELISTNKYKLLMNGENKFPEMFDAISTAKHHVHIEYYIWENDIRGNQLKDLLIRKAMDGVRVRVIYDAFGSRGIRKNIVREMKNAGVQVFPILKIKLSFLANRINHRNHRKIVVVDGKIGLVGGVNISDQYDNSLDNKVFWRDTHLKIEGPSVGSLQRHFITNWNFCSGENLMVNKMFFPHFDSPPLNKDKELAQIVAGGPDYKRSYIQLSFFRIFTLAKEKLYITTPYFIPDESAIIALKQAALGGVDVRLIVPEESDSLIVSAATKYYLEDLLNAGVKVYLYKKGFVHAKTIVADTFLSVIGTANMDIRSFDLNYEINAIIYGEEFGEKMEDMFYDDLKECRELTYADWEKISKWRVLGYTLARLLSHFL